MLILDIIRILLECKYVSTFWCFLDTSRLSSFVYWRKWLWSKQYWIHYKYILEHNEKDTCSPSQIFSWHCSGVQVDPTNTCPVINLRMFLLELKYTVFCSSLTFIRKAFMPLLFDSSTMASNHVQALLQPQFPQWHVLLCLKYWNKVIFS